MKIIVGLGNPGLRYRNTRHNIGFMVLDALSKDLGCKFSKKGFGGVYTITRSCGEEVVLFKPMTYMNLSGEAVKSICSSKMETVKDILVVVDDFNIQLGEFRIKPKGSAGGHNGLTSVIEHMGSDFARLRIGIGEEDMPEERAGYVLKSFGRKNRKEVETIKARAVDCVNMWLQHGVEEAMAGFNNTY